MHLTLKSSIQTFLILLVLGQFSCCIGLSQNPDHVRFYLYPSSEYPGQNQEIVLNNLETLRNSSFQSGVKTVFIVHGFRSDMHSEMPQDLKNAYLSSNLGYNYIVVNWGPLSTPTPAIMTTQLYFLVLANVPTVGERVADFVKFLVSSNVTSLGEVHLVGHSLGAHAVGLAGFNVQKNSGQKVSRVTGLDPAGPLYFPPVETRNLRSSDADFVDVIHTNAGFLGDMSKDGHADFWPNRGSIQPSCAADFGVPPFGNFGLIGICSHSYAYKLYAASLSKKFYACKCSEVVLDLIGLKRCPENCPDSEKVLMGYNCSSAATGNYYSRTSNPP